MIQKFKVARQVLFDRLYLEGETYEGDDSEVRHLVAAGVLQPLAAKAAPAVKNKAEPKLQNKAAG
ncbi:hypothetical protein [Brevundimonas balnearis]|uniref:Uncharacterized protein n=1 Tax=Brevundimonas balnearis TaxID=1572858 RepID=A0ABV6R0Z3_9CAUL